GTVVVDEQVAGVVGVGPQSVSVLTDLGVPGGQFRPVLAAIGTLRGGDLGGVVEVLAVVQRVQDVRVAGELDLRAAVGLDLVEVLNRPGGAGVGRMVEAAHVAGDVDLGDVERAEAWREERPAAAGAAAGPLGGGGDEGAVC